MGKSQRENVVAEFISASVGDKTRPYSINHVVSRGEVRALGPGGKNGGSLQIRQALMMSTLTLKLKTWN